MKTMPVELWRIFVGIGVVAMIRGMFFLRETMAGSAEIAGVTFYVIRPQLGRGSSGFDRLEIFTGSRAKRRRHQ